MAKSEAVKLKKEKVLTDADIMKYEIAEELGLLEKVNSTGWKSLTSKESGRIGGIMTRRRRATMEGADETI